MNENTLTFTKTTLTALPLPTTGRDTYKDAKTPGLQLRVTTTGVKTFCLFKRVNGKPERISLGRFPDLTVEQARRKVAELNGQIALGVSPSQERRKKKTESKTLGEHLEEYIQTRKGLKGSTAKDMRVALQHTCPDWMEKPILKITAEMVLTRHAQFGKERSEARANLAMRYLRAIFTFASHTDSGLAGKENPVKVLSKTKAWFRVKRRETLIKPHELRGWLLAVSSLKSDWGDYLLFLLLTGLRREEALGLLWEDVDFTGRTFKVRDTKNHRDHELPMSSGILRIIAKRRLSTDGRALSPKVFVDSQGKTLSNYRYAMEKISDACCVSVTPHDLRRTFASIAESLDISGYSLKRLLNHTTGDVTQGYVILNMERLRVLMERISNFVIAKNLT
jgi:integrase